MVRRMGNLSIPTPQDIKEAAKSRGWTIKRMCCEAGISTETFSRWKTGKHLIGLSKLQALLDALARAEQPTE
jgi:transcriptional regulator with XRE-family HTH domain